MGRDADNAEISARVAVVQGKRIVSGGKPPASRLVRTNIPERTPILPGESDLILQHIGDALANIFDP